MAETGWGCGVIQIEPFSLLKGHDSGRSSLGRFSLSWTHVKPFGFTFLPNEPIHTASAWRVLRRTLCIADVLNVVCHAVNYNQEWIWSHDVIIYSLFHMDPEAGERFDPKKPWGRSSGEPGGEGRALKYKRDWLILDRKGGCQLPCLLYTRITCQPAAHHHMRGCNEEISTAVSWAPHSEPLQMDRRM